MNNHILNLKGISVEKNDVCILEDINLEIKQGDFLNIYGSNCLLYTSPSPRD